MIVPILPIGLGGGFEEDFFSAGRGSLFCTKGGVLCTSFFKGGGLTL
jgi:hypothetical protein